QGTHPHSYGASLSKKRGKSRLYWLTGQPDVRIWRGEFDDTTASVSNLWSYQPPLGGSNNYLQWLTVVSDARGEEQGVMWIERQFLSSRQRVFFCNDLEGGAPVHTLFDAPDNNVVDGMSQFEGGTFLFACLTVGA